MGFASATIGEAVVKVRADTDSAQTEIRGLGSTMGKAFAAVGAGVVVTKFLKDAKDNAVDLREELAKAGVVFGQHSAGIEAFAKRGAGALGLAEVEVLRYASTFGNLFTAMKLPEEQSAQLSQSLVSLGVDMASFNNTTVDESLNALRSGLAGETEPLKRFGVQLNEATLKAKAAELGLGSFTGVLPPAIKLQATYALIMEQTAKAQGDFERTADGAANKSRIAAAQLQDLATTVGNGLYPAWDGFLTLMTSGVLPMLQWLANTGAPAVAAAVGVLVGELDRLTQPIQDFIATNPEPFVVALTVAVSGLAAVIGANAAGSLYSAISTVLPKLYAFATVTLGLSLPVLAVVAAIAALAGILVAAYMNIEGFRDAIDGLADGFQRIWAAFQEGGLGAAISQLGEELGNLGGFIRDAVAEWVPIIWDATKRGAAALWEWIVDTTPVVIAALWDFAKAAGDWLVTTGLPWLADKAQEGASALWQWIVDTTPVVLAQLGEMGAKLGAWITDEALPMIADKLGAWASAFGGWAREEAIQLIPNLIRLVSSMVAWLISDALPTLITTLGSWAVAFAAWVPGAIVSLLGKLATLYIEVASWLLAQIPGLIATFAQWAWSFIQWVPGATADLIGALVRFAAELVIGIVGALAEVPVKIGDALVEGTTKVAQWAIGVPGIIANGVWETTAKLLDAGRSIVRAIIDGIKEIAGGIWDAVMAAIPTAKDVAAQVGSVLPGGGGLIGGLIGRFARGGVAGPGVALVGEEGPELINLGTTSRVLSNRESAEALRPGGGILIEMHQPSFGADVGTATSEMAWSLEAAMVGVLAA